MKFKKSFLICMILLAIFSLGVVCGEDNSTLDDSSIQSTQEDSIKETVSEDVKIADEIDEEQNNYVSVGDENLNDTNSTKQNISIWIYTLDEIYPWSWADSDGDSGPGIDIEVFSENSQFKPTGNTTFYINGEVVGELKGEGHTLISKEILWQKYTGKGYYTFEAVYSGDENFKSANKTYEYYISRYVCSLEDDFVYVTLPSYVSGTLTVKANEKTYTKKIKATYHMYTSYSGETNKLELTGLKRGENYTINVDFKTDSEKYSFNETFNITDYVKNCKLEVYLKDYDDYYSPYKFGDSHYTYGDDNSIIFAVRKDITDKVNVTIDGETYKYSKITGDISYYGDSNYDNAYKVDIKGLKPGNHTVVVSYPGDSKYSSEYIETNITVLTEIKYVDEDVLSLKLPADAIGNFTLEIQMDWSFDYSIYESISPTGEKSSIQLPCGLYYMKAHYTSDDYDVKTLEYRVYISRDDSMNYGQTKQINLINKVNGTLVVGFEYPEYTFMRVIEFPDYDKDNLTINKELVDRVIEIDEAKYAIEQNHEEYGSYFLDLIPKIYSPTDEGYELNPIRINFAAKITGAKDITMYYGDSKTISLKVYDLNSELADKDMIVKIKIGTKTFNTRTNINGAVKFKIPNTVTPGKYTVTITYKNAKATTKLTVKHVLTLKTVKVKKSAKLTLQATLKNTKAMKNKQVTFKFSGKTYKAKTNSKGIAKVTVPKSVLSKLKVGKKVVYQATYLKNTVKKTVKVQK